MSGITGTSHSKSKIVGRSKDTAIAWVNFDGSTTPVAIRDSFNVSSITDHGTGYYTVTFATAIGNDDYSVATCCSIANNHPYTGTIGIYTLTSASARFNTSYNGQAGGSMYDSYWTTVNFFSS